MRDAYIVISYIVICLMRDAYNPYYLDESMIGFLLEHNGSRDTARQTLRTYVLYRVCVHV